MNSVVLLLIFTIFCNQSNAARIRNRKVKEAPRSCSIMREDKFLSRSEKRVVGTLRHSLLLENTEQNQLITLVKDKGERICQWAIADWQNIQTLNKLPELENFKFYIDEYKDILYPYIQKSDKSYFMLNIDLKSCNLNNQSTKVKLDLPKCVVPKKIRKKKKKKTKKIK